MRMYEVFIIRDWYLVIFNVYTSYVICEEMCWFRVPAGT